MILFVALKFINNDGYILYYDYIGATNILSPINSNMLYKCETYVALLRATT